MGLGLPFQGDGILICSTQGVALGWLKAAPSGRTASEIWTNER